MLNSHVDAEPREHRRALDTVFFIATITATPEPGKHEQPCEEYDQKHGGTGWDSDELAGGVPW